MKSRRFTLTMRPTHPLERLAIAALAGVAPGRRAERIRRLLRVSVGRRLPAVPWEETASQPKGRPMRLQVTVTDTDPEDVPIVSMLQAVHPAHVTEFLTERLLAGLAGESALDIVLDSHVETIDRVAPAPRAASQAVSIDHHEAPEPLHRPAPTVLDSASKDDALPVSVSGNEEARAKLRSELRGLFE